MNGASMPADDDRPLLLTGLPRCGSSWIGQVIAASSAVRYRYESLNPDWVPRLNGRPGHFRYQRPGTPGPAWLRRAAENALAGRQSWKQGLRAVYRGYGSSLLRRRGPLVLKDPTACLLAGWLEARYACRVVVLTRHPCGFAASITALGWTLRLDRLLSQAPLVEDHLAPHADTLAECRDDPLAALGAFWSAVHLVMHGQGAGRWTVHSFERLCLDPDAGFRDLSRELGIALPPPSPGRRHRTDPGSTAKDGVRVAHAWRKRFTAEEVQRILHPVRACGLSALAGLDDAEAQAAP